MPSKLLNTNYRPMMVDLTVAVKSPCRVRVMLSDPHKVGAVYYDRWKDIKDVGDFQIKLPVSPKQARLKVGTVGNHNNDGQTDIIDVKRKKLDNYAPCLNGNGGKTKKVKEFIKFAQEISENAAVYPPGTYYSPKKNFRIDYFPMIFDKDEQKALSTPARIHNETGHMEIAKKSFVTMTIPMRMAVLMHEFSHFNLNHVQEDEVEADLNALKLYLGMGYPIIEAHKGFLEVFKSHPSDGNRERYEYIKNFIDNWDHNKFRICLP